LSCGQSRTPARTVFIRDVVHNAKKPDKNTHPNRFQIMLPTLIVTFSILTAVAMLTKIFFSTRFLTLKNQPQNFIGSFLILVVSTIMIWVPFLFNTDNEKQYRLKKKINLLTGIFYVLVFLLAVIVFLQIQSIRNG
jgi:putative Mn2+ efflux pump MntP